MSTKIDSNQLQIDGKTIVINSSGQLAAVAPPAPTIAFVTEATLAGTVDGTNAVFTLPSAPNPVSSLALFRNGIRYKAGVDFTFSLTGGVPTITFSAGQQPQPGDVVLADYRQ